MSLVVFQCDNGLLPPTLMPLNVTEMPRLFISYAFSLHLHSFSKVNA